MEKMFSLWAEFDYVMWFVDLIGWSALEADGSYNNMPALS